MKRSESFYVPIRGLQYHCRVWGPLDAPKLFLVHGRDDLSASWQFMVDELRGDWRVIAPDWRGYGNTDRGGADSYWTHDYVADLSFLLDHFQPDAPVRIVGHSMGGSLASTLAGLFPERVERLVNIEGIGPPAGDAAQAPGAYRTWIEALKKPPGTRRFASIDELTKRILTEHVYLSEPRARFLAEAWALPQPDGSLVRRADPAHRIFRPLLWRLDEERAIWCGIRAPMLYIEGEKSDYLEKVRTWAVPIEPRVASFLTRVRTETFPGAGHNLHLEQPERLARVIEAFFQ